MTTTSAVVVLVGGFSSTTSPRNARSVRARGSVSLACPPEGLTLRSWRASWRKATAIQRVRWMDQAAFDASWAINEPAGPIPDTDAMLTMQPRPGSPERASPPDETHRPGKVDGDDLVPHFHHRAIEAASSLRRRGERDMIRPIVRMATDWWDTHCENA